MIPKPSYVMCEPHLSGYRVILGFDSLQDAQAAHGALAASTCGISRSEMNPKTPSPDQPQ